MADETNLLAGLSGVDQVQAALEAHRRQKPPRESHGVGGSWELEEPPRPQGLKQAGNINLLDRPIVKNTDGSISTVRSISIGTDKGEVLIPTVSDDGRVMSEKEAIAQYRRTRKHLGIFDSPASATAYAQQLSRQQDAVYNPKLIAAHQPTDLAAKPLRVGSINDIGSALTRYRQEKGSKTPVEARPTKVSDYLYSTPKGAPTVSLMDKAESWLQEHVGKPFGEKLGKRYTYTDEEVNKAVEQASPFQRGFAYFLMTGHPALGDTKDERELIERRWKLEQHFLRGTWAKLGEFISNPVNVAFMVAGGGLAKYMPAAATAVDAYFTSQMTVGATKSAVEAYHAGKEANWNVFASSSPDGVTLQVDPKAAAFWNAMGETALDGFFAHMGVNGLAERVATLRTFGEFEDVARQKYGKGWTELDANRKMRVLTAVQSKHASKGATEVQRLRALAQEYGLQPKPEDRLAAQRQYEIATGWARESARRAAELNQKLTAVDRALREAPPKTRRDLELEPPPILGARIAPKEVTIVGVGGRGFETPEETRTVERQEPLLAGPRDITQVDLATLDPVDREFARQKKRQEQAMAILERERERATEETAKRLREADERQKEIERQKRYQQQKAADRVREEASRIADRRSIRWMTQEEADQTYPYRNLLNALDDRMRLVSENNMFESPEAMARHLRRPNRDKPLTPEDQDFLRMLDERRYLERATDPRNLPPMGVSREEAPAGPPRTDIMAERLKGVENEGQARQVLDGASPEQLLELMMPMNQTAYEAGRVYERAGERPMFTDGRGGLREGSAWTELQGVKVLGDMAYHPEDLPKWAMPGTDGKFVLQVGSEGAGTFGQSDYVEPQVVVGVADPSAERRPWDWTDWAAVELLRREQELLNELELVDRQHDLEDSAAALRKDVENPESQKAAEEAEERAKAIQTEREQAAAQKAVDGAQQVVFPEAAPITEIGRGTDTEVVLPSGKQLKAHYALVSLDDLVASHKPLQNFEPNERYVWFDDAMSNSPLQPNDYANNQERQAMTKQRAAAPTLELIFNTMPAGSDGPPVVRRDGIVAGGNNREFILELLYGGRRGDEVVDAIDKTKAQFGITAETPDVSKRPAIVRVLEEPVEGMKELAELGMDLNRDLMTSRNIAEESAALALKFDQELKDWVASAFDQMDDEASLRDFMRKYSTEIADRMQAKGFFAPNQRSTFIQDGEMTEDAKLKFERASRGAVIKDPRALAILQRDGMRWLGQAIDRALPGLFRMVAKGGMWDVSDYLTEAVLRHGRIDDAGKIIDDRISEATAQGQKGVSKVDAYLYPEKLKGYMAPLGGEVGKLATERPTVHPIVEAFMRLSELKSGEIKKAMNGYSLDAEGGQATMFAPPPPWESFTNHIGSKVGVEVTQDDWGRLEKQAEERPIEAAVPPKVGEPEPQPATKYKFGNTQATIPDDSEAAKAIDAIRQSIPEDDLARKGKGVGGNHVTVRYGIRNDDFAGIQRFIAAQEPFEATLGVTEKFAPSESSDGAAVIQVPIDAPELHRLNEELGKHGDFAPPTFAEYKPHATIAYVKPEAADKYVGIDSTAGKKFLIDTIAITDRNGNEIPVRLQGKADMGLEPPPLPVPAEGGVTPPTAPAVPPPSDQVSEDVMRQAIAQHSGISPAQREGMITVWKAFAEKYLGIPLNELLGKAVKGFRIGGEYKEGEPGLQQNFSGMEDAELQRFVRESGRNIRIKEFGEQGDLFGGKEKVYNVWNPRSGKGALVTESQLQRIKDANPALEGQLQQGDMFALEKPVSDLDLEPPPNFPSQGTLFQADVAAPWYYSKAERAMSENVPAASSGEQWLKMLLNKGVKQAEIDAIGLDDFLKGKKKVTGDEVRDFIRENQVQVQEVVLGRSLAEEPTKYAQYTLPGGEKYRELLLTLPTTARRQITEEQAYDAVKRGQKVIAEGWDETGELDRFEPTAEEIEEGVNKDYKFYTELSKFTTGEWDEYYGLKDLEALRGLDETERRRLNELESREAQTFRSGHFGDVAANVLAHVRFNERTDADGKRVLFIEEVQSDWHQKGRKQGYQTATQLTPEDNVRLDETAKQIMEYVRDRDPYKREADSLSEAKTLIQAQYFGDPRARSLWEEHERLQGKLLESVRDKSRIPDAPFKTDWHELALKRMLRYAAENGYDRVAWTTGEMQNERYDLSQHIKTIRYQRRGDQTALWVFDKHSTPVQSELAERVEGASWDDDEKAAVLPNDKLADVVGKELADKIVRDEGTLAEGLKYWGIKEFSGLDLKVGGEGMKGFYDKMLPAFLNKYGKKFGAKVGESQIAAGLPESEHVTIEPYDEGLLWLIRRDSDGMYLASDGNSWTSDRESARLQFGDAVSEEAMKRNFKHGMTAVPSIDITPSMRSAMMEGQPLFQAGDKTVRGMTQFMEDGKAILSLFEQANFSTFAHESMHIMRRYLRPEDAAVLEKHAGVKDGQWGAAAEEKVARWWERYLRDGKAPNSELAMLFAKLKAWMLDIYRTLKGSPLDRPVPDAVRQVFDRMLTGERGAEREALEEPPKPREPEVAVQGAKPPPVPLEAPPAAPKSALEAPPASLETQRVTPEAAALPSQAGAQGGPIEAAVQAAKREAKGRAVKASAKSGDYRVSASLKGDTATLTAKLGTLPAGSISVTRDEWEHPGRGQEWPSVGNPAYDQRELVRRKMVEAGNADFAAEGGAQAERVADAYVDAINKVFEKAAVPPGELPEKPTKKRRSKAEIALDKQLTQTERSVASAKEDIKQWEGDIGTIDYFLERDGNLGPNDFDGLMRFGFGEATIGEEDISDEELDALPEGTMHPLVRRQLEEAKEQLNADVSAAKEALPGWEKDLADLRAKELQMQGLETPPLVSDLDSEPPTEEEQNTLFQIDQTTDRDRKLALIREKLNGPLTAATRSQLQRMLDEMTGKAAPKVAALEPPAVPVSAPPKTKTLEPPPSKPVRIWTPSGWIEVTPHGEAKPTTTPRGTAAHGADRDTEPRRPVPVLEPKAAAPGTPPDLPPRGGVPPAGRTGGKGSDTGTPERPREDGVRPVEIDAPKRHRGAPLYTPDQWKQTVDVFRLPEGAPVPYIHLDDDLKRLLIFPGQPEMAESVLSGLDQHDAYVLASTTGTGKTYLASAVMQQLKRRKPINQALIITASQNLIKDFKTVGLDFDLEIKSLPPGVAVPDEPGIYATTYQQALQRDGIEKHNWDFVVADEIAAARRWYDSKQGAMTKDLANHSKKILYMSATPFHTALELGHMDKLGLWQNEGFDTWGRQFGIYRDRDGNYGGGNAPRRLLQLRQQMIERGQYMNVDRNMEGYFPHFALTPLSDETKVGLRGIIQGYTMAMDYWTRKGKPAKVRTLRGLMNVYIKSYLERARLPQAIEMAKRAEAAGYKVIFFSEHKASRDELQSPLQEPDEHYRGELGRVIPPLPGVVEELKKAFPNDLANFSGKHSVLRDEEKDSFLSNEKRHIYLTYGAGGVGVSLHDIHGKYPRVAIYLGAPYSGVMLDQAIGRPWRYGTKSNVQAYFLVSDARDEVDLVLKKVAPRLESLRAIVSGVNMNDPMTVAMRQLEVAQEEAIGYDLGQEHRSETGDLVNVYEHVPITNYQKIDMPTASEQMNKGMKYPGEGPSPHPGIQRMYQAEEYELPKDLTVPDSVEAELANREIAEDVAKGNGGPGMTPEELKEVPAPERVAVAETGQLLADGAREDAEPDAKATAVRDSWRQTAAYLKAAKIMAEVKEQRPYKAGRITNWMWFTSGREVIRRAAARSGKPDLGQELARNIAEYHTETGNVAGPLQLRYTDIVKGLTSEEHRNMWLVKEGATRKDASGKKVPVEAMNEKVARAVVDVRQLLFDVHSLLAKEGIATRVYDESTGRYHWINFSEQQRDPRYMPHRYNYEQEFVIENPHTHQKEKLKLRDILKGRDLGEWRYEQIVQKLMKEHDVTRAEVEDWIGNRHREQPLMGNLERAREVNMPYYRTDPEAMIGYLEGVGELVARERVFGQSFSDQSQGYKLDKKILQIPEKRDRDIIRNVFSSLLSRKHWDDDTRSFLTLMGDWSVLSKMTFSALKVPFHLLHASLYTDTRSLLGGIFEGVTDWQEAKRRATDSGAVMEQMRAELMSELNMRRKLATRALEWTQFHNAYTIDRILANSTARVWMDRRALPKLLKDARNERIRRDLKEVYLLSDEQIDRAIANRQWTEDDYRRAGKSLSDKVMFTFDPTELPPAWRARSDEPIADSALAFIKVTTLLKSFMFKTARIMKERLVTEAVEHHNVRPWIPFLLLYPLAGEAMRQLGGLATLNPKQIQGLVQATEDPKKLLERYAEDIGYATAMTEAFFLTHASRGAEGWALLETLVGPAYSDILKTLYKFPKDYLGAKSDYSRFMALKRWLTGTVPATRPAFQLGEEAAGYDEQAEREKARSGSGATYHPW